MIQVAPYVVRDGIPNFRDSELVDIYRRLEKDGGKYSAYRGGAAHFVHEVKSGLAILHLAFFEQKPVGIGILNDFRGRYAYIHLVVFREFLGRKHRDKLREWALTALHASVGGEHIWDGFIALVPSENRLAVKCAKECGFREVGVIPFGYYHWQEEKSEPAVMLYLERGQK